MTNIRKELTYSISDDMDTLLVRQDLIGNLELTYKEKNYDYTEQHFTFIPKEFIPHLIEVLKEYSDK